MKIESLHIKNYKQFSDLDLDLTYPSGHEKDGEPLDKICIIGQSGTGKTNLLDIIKKSTIDFSEQNSYLPFSKFVGKDTDDRYITAKFKTEKKFNAETLFTDKTSKIIFKTKNYKILENEKNYFVGADKVPSFKEEEIIFNEDNMSRSDKTLLDGLEKQRKEVERLGISYYEMEGFEAQIRNIDLGIESIKLKYSMSKEIEKLRSNNFLDRYIININDEVDSLWKTMKEKIDNYKVERDKYKDQLTNKLLVDDTYDKKDFKDDFKAWEKENENLLENIAGDINFILKKFNLELTKIDENQKSYNALTIKDLSNDAIIEYDDLSTGTKNLISTFIPLKTYAPKNSLILIDEPEMSFYPDIQRQLIDLYENVGVNNQLIVATHSPLIASSFEPWEVVELKFDENNQIYRELYYKDENHVKNYFHDPRLLTWTSILTDIFDLKEDSNFTFREKKLMEYASLKTEIKAMIDKDSNDAQDKIAKFKKISGLLGLQN